VKWRILALCLVCVSIALLRIAHLLKAKKCCSLFYSILFDEPGRVIVDDYYRRRPKCLRLSGRFLRSRRRILEGTRPRLLDAPFFGRIG
jgi:hypothetical protein